MAQSVETYIALMRFGYGASAAGVSKIGADATPKDVKTFLRQQLVSKAAPKIGTTQERAVAFRRKKEVEDALRKQGDDDSQMMRKDMRRDRRDAFREDMVERLRMAMRPDLGFRERLVHFWSNHFTISVKGKQVLEGLAAPYEQEAIRSQLNGNFSEMLLAVTKHPAMQLYLENNSSTGPNSRVGQRRNRGLNENHAREILELHTMGVGSGYTQADVLALAKMMTGWTVNNQEGVFRFRENTHEPGAQKFLGKRYAQEGVDQAEAALLDIAAHPETAKFVTQKLAKAMHSDAPPKSLLKRLEKVFVETKGDLPSLHQALIESPEMWTTQGLKLKSPIEVVTSMLIALGQEPSAKQLYNELANLGEFPFMAPSPEGWSIDGSDWTTPSEIKLRLILSDKLARRFGKQVDPAALGDATLGPFLSADTAFMLKGASSAEQGLTLLFMAPEFQRR